MRKQDHAGCTCQVDPHIADLTAASCDKELNRFVNKGAAQRNADGLEQAEALILTKQTVEQTAPNGKDGKMRQLSQKFMRKKWKKLLHKKQKSRAFLPAC